MPGPAIGRAIRAVTLTLVGATLVKDAKLRNPEEMVEALVAALVAAAAAASVVAVAAAAAAGGPAIGPVLHAATLTLPGETNASGVRRPNRMAPVGRIMEEGREIEVAVAAEEVVVEAEMAAAAAAAEVMY